MRKIKHISSVVLIVILVISIKISGCEQEDLDFYIDCNDCLSAIPESANLIIYLTINDENPFVPLILYRGDFEDNIEDYRDTAYEEIHTIYSEMDMSYSIKATYQVDGKPYVAIDGDKMTTENGDEECYSPCYIIRGGTFDLRIK